MAKLSLQDITSGYASTAALNANFAAIEEAVENTLSRDGTTPNQMEADLDLNGFRILNQGNPVTIEGFEWQGDWATATVYSEGAIVTEGGSSYICVLDHTSNDFAIDLSSGYWQLLVTANLPDQAGNAAKFLQTNGSSASWEVPDSTEVTYTSTVSGTSQRTIQAAMESSGVSVKDFGAVGDGVTNDAPAINAAIAALNAGTISYLYFPTATYILASKLDTITASNFMIDGRMSVLQYTAPSVSECTFFTVGSASALSDNFVITNFGLRKNNSNDVTSDGYAFEIDRASDGFISNIFVTLTAGLVKLGSASYAASRIRFENIDGVFRVDKGGRVIDIEYATGFRFDNCRFTANASYIPAASGFRGIYIKPSVVRTIDSGIFQGLEFNFPDYGVERIVEMDATGGSIITNQFFNSCIFDHAITSAIYLHIDSGATGAGRIANIQFTSCRAVCEDDGGPIVLDNTGNKTMIDIGFIGGFYNTWDEPAVRITSGNVLARFIGTRFSDVEGVTAKPVIRSASGELIVTGCSAIKHNALTTSSFNYGVQFTAAVNGFVVTNNKFDRCTVADVDTRLLNNSNAEQRMVEGNTAPLATTNFYLKTTDATATVIASQPLLEGFAYHVRATVIGTEVGGGSRASYVLEGTYYRSSGGNVTQQGSTTAIHTVESDSAWAAEFVNSTTAVQVRVTGKAATTISWGCHIEVLAVPYNP